MFDYVPVCSPFLFLQKQTPVAQLNAEIDIYWFE